MSGFAAGKPALSWVSRQTDGCRGDPARKRKGGGEGRMVRQGV